ncbi:MAG: hypothetical protein WAL05_00235 [Candidatus Sulfotelmatobacter sp.]
MPYILEHLSSLRQEITDLRNMNARFIGKGSDHQIDQSAMEMRAHRLAEIKKELSQMLNRPEDPAVWWEKADGGIGWRSEKKSLKEQADFLRLRSGQVSPDFQSGSE